MSKRTTLHQPSSQPAGPGDVQLCLRSPGSEDSVFPLQKPVTRIGRLDENDIVIADEEISDFHALFQRTQDGGIEIIDQDSNRGLFVNGRREKRARVKPGDVILFGPVEAVLEEPSPEIPIREPVKSEAAPLPVQTVAVAANAVAGHPAAALHDLEAARQEISALRNRLEEKEKNSRNGAGEAREGRFPGFGFLGGDRKARKLETIEAAIAERSVELKRLTQELAEVRRNLDHMEPLRRELQQIEARHQTLLRETTELNEAKSRLSTYEQDLLELKGSEDKLRKSRERLESWVRTLEKDRATLEKELAGLQQAVGAARLTRDEAEAQRDECLSGRDRILREMAELQAEQGRCQQGIRELEEQRNSAALELGSRQDDLKLLRAKLAETRAAMEKAAAELEEKRGEHQALTDQCRAMTEELAEFAQSRGACREELQNLEKALEERKSLLADLAAALSETEEKRDALGRQAEAEEFRLSELQSQISAQKSALSQLREMTHQSQLVKDGLERQAEELRERLAELGDNKQKLESRLADLAEGLHSKEVLLTETEALIDEANLQFETASQAIASREEALARTGEKLRETETALRDLEGQVKASTSERNQLEAEINRFQQQVRAIEDRRANLESDITELQEQLREQKDQSIAAGRQLEELHGQVERAQAGAAEAQHLFELESEKLAGLREASSEQTAILEALRVETVDARKEIEQLAAEKRALVETLDVLETKRESLDDLCTDLDSARRQKQEDLQRLDNEFMALREAFGKAQQDAETQARRIAEEHREWGERIAAAEEELRACQAARQAEENRTRAIQEEGKLARKDLEELHLAIASRQETVLQLQLEGETIQQEITALKADKKQLAVERDAAGEELESLRSHLAEATSRLADLRALVDAREMDLAKFQSEVLSQRAAAEEEIQSRRTAVREMEDRLREAERSAQSVSGEAAAERRRLDELKREGQADVARLQATLKRLGDSITSRTQELSQCDAGVTEKRGHLEELKLRQEALLLDQQSRLEQLLAQRKVAEEELAAKFSEIEAANAALEESGMAKRRLAEIRAGQERAQEDLARVNASLVNARAEEEALQRTVAALHQRTSELERLQAEIAAKEAEVKRHEERSRLLQERRAQLERAINLETGTVQAFAGDLIKRIDSLDELLIRLRDGGQQPGLFAPLEAFRQSLLETLGDYSVQAYEYPRDAQIDPAERQLVRIVKARSERPKKVTRVIETVRRGYRHVAANGVQTVLRKADIVTTHP